MPAWVLFLVIWAAWMLTVFAAAARKAVDDARDGLPSDQRRGASLPPDLGIVLTLIPWAIALAIDAWAPSWGTWTIGGLAIAALVAMTVYIFWSIRRLRLHSANV